jgi:mevalonate kinase
MRVTVPGKVAIIGEYLVLLGNQLLAIPIYDKNKNGVIAEIQKGKRLVISEQFGLEEEPSIDSANPIIRAYSVVEKFVGKKLDYTIKLTNSAIFQDKNFKTGLGSSGAAIVAVVKSLLLAENKYTSENVFKLSVIAKGPTLESNYDLAVAAYENPILYRPKYDVMTIFERFNQGIYDNYEIEIVKFPYKVYVYKILGGSTSTIKSITRFLEIKDEVTEYIENAKKYLYILLESLIKKDTQTILKYKKFYLENMKKIKIKIFGQDLEKDIREWIDSLDVSYGVCSGSGGLDNVALISEKEINIKTPSFLKKIEIYG